MIDEECILFEDKISDDDIRSFIEFEKRLNGEYFKLWFDEVPMWDILKVLKIAKDKKNIFVQVNRSIIVMCPEFNGFMGREFYQCEEINIHYLRRMTEPATDVNVVRHICMFLEQMNRFPKNYLVYSATGKVEAMGPVNLSNMGLNTCPVYFTEFSGREFKINDNNLTSLLGVPNYVTGDFDCSNNKLTSLVHGPTQAYGYFCEYNELTSLEGAPVRVNKVFNCSNNKLTDLTGMPQINCTHTQITDLDGKPIVVYS